MYKQKTVKLIAAMTHFHATHPFLIGNGNALPWPPGTIPSDMRRFRQLTRGGSLIIGRLTWDSIPLGFRPFDNDMPAKEARQTIIVTRSINFWFPDPRVIVAHSLEEALDTATRDQIWICGGAQIYKQSYAYVDELHMTQVKADFVGDTYFPHIQQTETSKVVSATIDEGRLDIKDKYDTKYILAKILRS